MNDEEIIVVIGEEEEQEGVVVEGDVLKGKNGTDGYTPVKGVDYFDGVDGYTPVKGTDYFTETEIQQIKQDILNDVSSFDLLVVDSLPTENIQEKTIYLAPNTETTENNVYDEYIYVNGSWEVIGSTAVDTDNLTVNLVENSYDLTLTEAVTSGGTITLPSMYKVGSDRLDVYLNGEKLIKAEADDTEGHYYEVGTQGTLSNVIQITSDWKAEVGDVFEFTIRTNGEAEIEAGVGEIENGVVLWENPNPTAEISTSGINITLDENLFDSYEVYYKPTTTSSTIMYSKSLKGTGVHLEFNQGSNDYYRNIKYVSENNYLIEYANVQGGSSTELANHTKYIIPLKIIGYKNTMPAVVVKINDVAVSNTEPTNGEKIWIRNGEKNLFDPVLATKEYYINMEGTKVANSNWTISDYIKVTPNKAYTYQGLTNVGGEPSSVYYDMDKKQVSIFKQAVGINTITIPSNVYYVRFSINAGIGDADTFMIEEGNTASDYEPYKGIYILNNNNEYEKFM